MLNLKMNARFLFYFLALQTNIYGSSEREPLQSFLNDNLASD